MSVRCICLVASVVVPVFCRGLTLPERLPVSVLPENVFLGFGNADFREPDGRTMAALAGGRPALPGDRLHERDSVPVLRRPHVRRNRSLLRDSAADVDLTFPDGRDYVFRNSDRSAE